MVLIFNMSLQIVFDYYRFFLLPKFFEKKIPTFNINIELKSSILKSS